jgi:ATP-dependent DNA helicase RecG
LSEDSKYERSLSEVLSEVELKKLKPLIDHLETNKNITPQVARNLTGKSAATIRRYLTLLCDRGILESTGSTNAVVYHLKRRG